MSIYGVTVIRKSGTELYQEARSWAAALDLPFIPGLSMGPWTNCSGKRG